MFDQPCKNDNSKHQHFQCRPAAAQIHRLEFSIASTSRNIHVRGHSNTNNSDRNSYSNNKLTSSIQDENNNRNLGRRAGSAFSFQPRTNTISSVDRTMISHPQPTAPAPTLSRLASNIEGSASSSRPSPLPPSSTSAKRPGKAPPEHRLAKAAEQAQTPPKSLTVRLPEESTMHLKNTTTEPKTSVSAFSAPNPPALALHHQHSPPRISSDLSSGCSPPATHCSGVPALPPKPEGVELTCAGQLTESVGHRPQELAGREGISERSLQPASSHDLDAITNIAHTTMLKQEEEPSSTSQVTKLSSSSLVVFPSIASITAMPSDRCHEGLSSSSSRAVHTHAPQRESTDLPDITAMLMDRMAMKQQWMESEQLLSNLVGELRMRVKEESDKYHNAQQKVQVTSALNAALQAQNIRLQSDVAVMEARVADFQTRVQGLDADRKKQAEVYEASRSQMAAQLASVRQVSMEASFALEGLATAKSRWEVEVATLRADMQTMESERSRLRTSYDHLTESFSVCSGHLKYIQTAYEKVQGVCESRQEEVNQYRTRCELLSDQLRYLSEKVEKLHRENDERRVANEALQVTNHSMYDRIEFLKQASEYQQSILTAQLRDVEDKCRESYADELSKIKHDLAGAKEVVKDVAVLESRVRESTLKAETLMTRNAQLDAELRTLKEGTAHYQEVITQLQETKQRLESENQRLMQSSMSAQADYAIELNATVERCEELRQRQVNESQTVIDEKEAQIGELTRHLETKTREFQKLADEKQRLSELVEYQAQTAAATDRDMLELRVKIQLLQSDHNFVAKARDDLKAELEALQQAHEAQQQLMQQQSLMPMPLTDIVRLHNRDLEGGGGGAGSASGTDFLQWPMDLRTPPSIRSSSRTDPGAAAVRQGSESPSFVSLPACSTRAPSTLATARSKAKTTTIATATTPTSAVGTSGSRSRGVTTPSSSSTTTAAAAAAAVLTTRTRSSTNPAAAAVTAAGRGEKRSLKRKRNVSESGCRAGGDDGGGAEDGETGGEQEGDLEAAGSGSGAGPSTSTSTSTGGVGVDASTMKARRTRSKRLAQQPPQTGSSSSLSSTTAASAPATKKSSRRK